MHQIKIENRAVDNLLHEVYEAKEELKRLKDYILKCYKNKPELLSLDTLGVVYATIHLTLTDLERVTREQVENGYEIVK